MKAQYISIGIDGMEFHDTEAEALAHAEAELECFRKEAHEGWSDEVMGIMVAKVTHVTAERDLQRREDFDEDDDDAPSFNGFDYLCDYVMTAVDTEGES